MVVTETRNPALQDHAQNKSIPEGCITNQPNDAGFLPWNNTHNIITFEERRFINQISNGCLQLLFLIGGPANFISAIVFAKQGLKDRINLLLFSISIADELYLCTHMLLKSEEFFSIFTGKPHPSPLYVFVLTTPLKSLTGAARVSSVLTAIIACERCCCVMWPLKYQTLMRTRTMAVIVAAVFVSVIGLQYLAVSKFSIVCAYDPLTGITSQVFSGSEFYQKHKEVVDYVESIVFGIGTGIVVMFVVVIATLITIWKLRQAVTWRTETGSSVSDKEVALTKMLVGVSVLFCVCVFPSFLRRVASIFVPDLATRGRYENLYTAFTHIGNIGDFVNASLNIFIYYGMSSRYRMTLCGLFQRNYKDTPSTR